MERDQLIQRLIHDELEKLDARQYSHRLLRGLERQFRDLGEMSDLELAEELTRRGLAAEFDDGPLGAGDEADDADDDAEDGDVRFLMRDLQLGDDDFVSARR